jgi:penicillin-binding protein 1A
MKQLEVGDRAWLSVVGEINAGEPVSLSLERYPELQGAAVVVQQGKIKALAGGSENRFFNRATQAKRTMGSAFKPLVYAAALQLGWNSADLLKNTRNVFVYYDQPYYPRPDHKSPHEWVSMSWAGVHSENLASVWLLSNLSDKLTPLQFREVADRVGLGPKIIDGKQESYQSYRDRIRDKYGIQVTRDILRKTAFDRAVKNIEADFIFDGMIDEYTRIQQLHYGLHFDRYLAQLKKELAEEKRPVKNYVVDEYQLKMGLLEHHYLKLEDLFRDLTLLRQKIEQPGLTEFTAAGDPDSTARSAKLSSGGSLYVSQTDGRFYFLGPGSIRSGMTPVTELRLQQYLKTLDRQQTSWFWESIELDGQLSVAAFTRLQEQLELEYASLLGRPSFDFEVLAGVEDFRITVGLYYLIELAKQLGIKSTLEPVLSFPLGSNVVSLLEATRMYESLITGVTTSFGSTPPDGSSNSEKEEDFTEALAIINRIESEQGAVLFEPQAEVKTVIDAKTSLAIGSILENIVKFGTGQYAGSHVFFADKDDQQISEIEEMKLPVPLLGKTGTANLYTNAAFLGYVPEINAKGTAMTVKEGYAVGVYVGFDDNSPMRRNSSRITGSAGALPTWSSIANTLLLEHQYAARLDPVDLSFYGLAIKRDPLGQLNLAVDTEAGGIVREPIQQVSDLARTEPSIMTFGQISEHGGLVMERNYRPFWDNITADADQSDSTVLQQ